MRLTNPELHRRRCRQAMLRRWRDPVEAAKLSAALDRNRWNTAGRPRSSPQAAGRDAQVLADAIQLLVDAYTARTGLTPTLSSDRGTVTVDDYASEVTP